MCYIILIMFNDGGMVLYGNLVQGTDGSLYGMSSGGAYQVRHSL